MLTFESAFLRGFLIEVHCEPCRRREAFRMPADSPHMERPIEEVWRSPGFRCGRCGRRATALNVCRMLKSGRRWAVEHSFK